MHHAQKSALSTYSFSFTANALSMKRVLLRAQVGHKSLSGHICISILYIRMLTHSEQFRLMGQNVVMYKVYQQDIK